MLFLDAERSDIDLKGKDGVVTVHESVRCGIRWASLGGAVGPQSVVEFLVPDARVQLQHLAEDAKDDLITSLRLAIGLGIVWRGV